MLLKVWNVMSLDVFRPQLWGILLYKLSMSNVTRAVEALFFREHFVNPVFSARSILCSNGNQVETFIVKLWPYMNPFRPSKSWRSGRKEELKNLLMWGEFSFHIMVDREIFTNVKNEKKLILIVNKKFKMVNGAVWSNSPIFLIINCLE